VSESLSLPAAMLERAYGAYRRAALELAVELPTDRDLRRLCQAILASALMELPQDGDTTLRARVLCEGAGLKEWNELTRADASTIFEVAHRALGAYVADVLDQVPDQPPPNALMLLVEPVPVVE
jgi:hypothetical protein